MLIFVAVGVVVLVVVVCLVYVYKTYNAIDRLFDRVLAKDATLRAEITGENRLSKLTHKAARILNIYTTEAAQTQAEKETIQGFISDMAHQMKTPLAGITMYADLLLEGGVDAAEQSLFFTQIQRNADNLQWMMDSLIKMSRLEVGAIQLTPDMLPLQPTLLDAIAAILPAAAKKNIEVAVDPFTDAPLRHDKRWTQEAIANLLENAVKYSPADSIITIRIEPLPLHTKIIIADRGTGIDRREWHLIFKRFYRGTNAKHTEGAGLGLYLVRLIMEKQGGYVMVDSTLGAGTAFSLYFQC